MVFTFACNENEDLSKHLCSAVLDGPSDRLQEVNDALVHGKWNVVRRFVNCYKEEAFRFRPEFGDTALSVAIKRGQGYFFISKLVELTPPGLLTQTDNSGDTALHAAAELGNVKTADLLVNKKQELLSFSNNKGLLPIQVAANRDHREMTSYLLSFGMRDEIYYNLLKGAAGLNVLRSLINARYFGEYLKLYCSRKIYIDTLGWIKSHQTWRWRERKTRDRNSLER